MDCDMYGQSRESIRLTDPHRHKYADAMAEFLDRDPYNYADEHSGSVECPTGWFSRFGKRLLLHDERGFVSVEKYRTEAIAQAIYEGLDRYYCAWDSEFGVDDPDLPEDEFDYARSRDIDAADAYLLYVRTGEMNDRNFTPAGFTDWLNRREHDATI